MTQRVKKVIGRDGSGREKTDRFPSMSRCSFESVLQKCSFRKEIKFGYCSPLVKYFMIAFVIV